MNTLKLIARSAAYYWRTHVGVAAGTAVATAVLVGALVVGDSVRYSLRTMALRRLGNVQVAMAGWDRFFRARAGGGTDDLAADVAARLGAPVAPVLLLDGSVRLPDGSARANRVQIVGVDARFWQIGGARDLLAGAASDEVAVNRPLAEQLGLAAAGQAAQRIVVRVPVPSGLPKDAPLSREKDAARGIPATVRAVVDDTGFGRFSLRTNQVAPFTVFLPLATLQQKLNLPGKANVMLVGAPPGAGAAVTPADADAALRESWTLADADLTLRPLGGDVLELRTGRVFLDAPVARAAAKADPRCLRVLTYFVNEVRLGKRASPYCIVAAMDPNRPAPRPDSPDKPMAPPPPSPVPAGLRDDEVVLNRWLADDIGAKAGDQVEMTYSVIGPMRTFEERKRTFRVHSVVPIAGAARDPNLMPDFPGLAETKSCRDWDPGIPIDLTKLEDPNDKYNQYWLKYRGTPKAFVTLPAGREMWGNRFGDLTAVRYRAAGAEGVTDPLARKILEELDPNGIGLYFLPVRTQALAAAEPTSDFGELFLGLSFFLIAAAVLLTGLLFVFNVEQRSRQVGLLLAVGFRPWRVRWLLLAEGGVLALAGCVVGAAAGLGYTRGVLWGLAKVWTGVSSSPILFHADAATVAMGAAIGLVVAMAAMLATLVLQGRATARELLAAGAEGRVSAPAGHVRRLVTLAVGVTCLAGAVAMVAMAAAGSMEMAGAFFGSGGLLLIAGLCFCYVLLARFGRGGQEHVPHLARLGVRTSGRRRGRSLTTVGLLACGVFLVASVEVFRADPNRNADKPASGSGGFALYGESSLPVLGDLNDPDQRERLGLDSDACRGARVVQLRVHEGDDASCLNLNRAQQPRLLGVVPERLAGRFAFQETLGPAGNDPWTLLNAPADEGQVPAIGDDDTLRWALHKGLGETVEVTDERGRTVRLKLVGRIGGSIFQGNLLISDRHFRQRFPSSSGYRALLIDAGPAGAAEASKAFSSALEDFGLELMPAARRLGRFMEVKNAYLSIFAALGGLGMVLGSVALGIVVLRNVLERRGELALLRAVGFTRGQLRWLVLAEHWTLLVLGLVCGVGSALIAVLPALRSPEDLPYVSWGVMLGGVVLSGLLWTWLAAAAALRGELMPALRTE